MTSVTVEMLYKSFGVLADAKEKASEHPEAYETILKGFEGNQAAKRLAAQFISRFFKFFSSKADDAINAIFNLCEDEDISIRRAAIKEFPNICKGDISQLPRLADVLVQLMQSDDSGELSTVNTALVALFKLNAKGTLKGLYSQLHQGDELIRENAISFLCTKLKTFPEDVMTKEVEEYVLEETKKIMEDVTGDEFHQLIKVISSLSHLQTFQGRQQILNIIVEKITIEEEFNAKDEDSVNKILQCMKIAQPLYSRNVHSTELLSYICERVLPKLSEFPTSTDLSLEILKLLAEMSSFVGNASKTKDSITSLYKALLEYMPLPNQEDEEASTATSDDPKFNFSYVECLLYAFYQLSSKQPEFLTNEESSERLKDFRKRLQYFARGLSVYIRQLRLALQGKSREDLKNKPENKLKLTALKTCNNINTLVKDLFHNPPSYKSSITLSWKLSAAAPEADKQILKRSAPATNGDAKKSTKGDRQLYKTPSGKYSTGMEGATAQGSGGRGGYRKRGGGNKRRFR